MAKRPTRVPTARQPLRRRWSRARKLRRDIATISSSGLFDQEWYELQARGRTFSGPDDAIRHYLRSGRRAGLSPHPLFLPSWYDPSTWRTTRRDPLLRFLNRHGEGSPHPLFDSRLYLRRHPEARDDPAGALGHFLSSAPRDAPMPTRVAMPRPLDRATAEQGLWSGLLQSAHDADLDRTARRRSWNDAAERAFRARHAGRPLPPADPARPSVSVVMPVKDRAEQVGVAIESVLAQTLPSWELLVVDDGSTDLTPEVLQQYAADDSRIRVLRLTQWSGVSVARNTALDEARGTYVAFLDSDNTWVPDFLALMTAEMAATGSRLAHAVVRGDQDGAIWFRASSGGRDELLVDNFIDLNAVVVERALVTRTGGFAADLRRMVDWDLLIRLADIEPPRLFPFVGVQYDDSRRGHERITTSEVRGWREVILSRHLIDWERAAATLRVPGRVSVIIPTYDDWEMTVRAVSAVLTQRGPDDIEVVVVDNGSDPVTCQLLTAVLAGVPGVVLVRQARNCQFALGSNLGFVASSGAKVVFLNNDTVVHPGWLAPLLAEISRPEVAGAQSLLLYPDGTVQCAGVAFPEGGGLPSHFLVDHPAEDAVALGTVSTWAITGAAFAIDAARFAQLRGFDPIYTNGWEDIDLCLRAGDPDRPAFRVVTASRVTHFEGKSVGRSDRIGENRKVFVQRWGERLPRGDTDLWRAAGLDVAHYRPDPPAPADPTVARVSRPVVVRPGHAGRLRWAIKCAAPAGPQGEVWGDTHFARALARSLRRLGQDVVVDRVEAHQRVTSYLDDVVVNVRGLEDFAVQPGRINLMWVISHPELVTPEEVGRYDAVFAASLPWSEQMTAASGRKVRPLLQATDPALFSPDRSRAGTGAAVLFVGSSRNVRRQIVEDAVLAGLPITLHGPRWERFYPGADFLRPSVPYEQVGEMYGSAGVVLNDHWDQMARLGFVSNRLFDAVASGARVVSDSVAGLQELFQGAVQTYDGLHDLRSLAGADRDTRFPTDDERRRIADDVRRDHSFDVRARELLTVALELR